MKEFPSTPIGYASHPHKGIINLTKPFAAAVQFYTGKGVRGIWDMSKVFNDERHMDNFISFMERNKGWKLDEVWLLKNINPAQ
jgi:hypothetical protein